MPKRLVDGDAIAESDKLAECREEFVPHYALLVTESLANGSFECTAGRLARKFAKVMPHMDAQAYEMVLAEFERVRLLFRWDAPDGKTWGILWGIQRYLPRPSEVRNKHYKVGAPVPVRALAAFLGLPYPMVARELARKNREEGVETMSRHGRDGVGRGRGKRGDNVAPGLGLDLGRDKGGVGVGFGGAGKGKGLAAAQSSSPTAPPPAQQQGGAPKNGAHDNSFANKPKKSEQVQKLEKVIEEELGQKTAKR